VRTWFLVAPDKDFIWDIVDDIIIVVVEFDLEGQSLILQHQDLNFS
jgi:hypothetical protein